MEKLTAQQVVALVAMFLWKFPLFVARTLISPAADETTHQALSAKAIYTVAFVILGFYVLFLAISDTAYWWAYLVYAGDTNSYPAIRIGLEQKAAMVATAVEFVMSLLLIFGSRQIATFISRLRYAGSG